MIAETLERAASLIRAEHPTCTCGDSDCETSDAPFWLAVADLLDREAATHRFFRSIGATGLTDSDDAFAIARAYMGES